jgi:hypothetical protein
MIAADQVDYFLPLRAIVALPVLFAQQTQKVFASRELVVGLLGNSEGWIETPWRASVECIFEMAMPIS